jgi:hypothetical protein
VLAIRQSLLPQVANGLNVRGLDNLADKKYHVFLAYEN